MTSKILNVAGMSCEHCKMAVTNAVSALDGVKDVEVSLENNTATVEFEESKLLLETIRQAIQAQGYEVVS
jgi:copper chaperone